MIPISLLDEWTRGLVPDVAARALLGLGLDPSAMAAARAAPGRGPHLVEWTLREDARATILDRSAEDVANDVVDAIYRVAVSGDVVAIEVARRLQSAPSVAAAFAAVRREPGSLRRRPWRWPLRVGLLGFGSAEAEILAEAIRRAARVPAALVDVRRVEDEPAAVDLLVTKQTLEQSTPLVVAAQPLANAVIVAAQPQQRWPVVEGMVSTMRGATGAVAAAVVPSGSLDGVGLVIREMSHSQPLDLAAAAAWQGEALLWAEPAGLEQSAVRQMAVRRVRELRAARSLDLSLADPALETHLVEITAGRFDLESAEASQFAEANAALDASQRRDERWLQALVNPDAAKARRNRFRRGENEVRAFIGPLVEDALTAPTPLDESALPWDEEDVDAFRLTIVFVPLVPRGDPQTAQIDLPRVGRSEVASFRLDVPRTATTVSARLVVAFRNRIIQTAVLSGSIGQPATLGASVALVDDLDGLDERTPFDAALLSNHAVDDLRALLAHSQQQTVLVSGVDALLETTKRMAEKLARAANLTATPNTLKGKTARDILVGLAVDGRELHDRLPQLAEARRIQVISAGGDWFLPIELAYEREAPDPGAQICENFLRDPASCGPACPERLDVLCPGSFWGLSRTIERHRFDSDLQAELGERIALVASPRENRRQLVLQRAVFGASSKVREPALGSTAAALGVASVLRGWKAWAADLENQDTHLLVLLPHTSYAPDPTLEISKEPLERGRIEQRHVTGGRDVRPVVVLFGCRTSGSRGDPSGFASRFMLKKAAVVFHSLADLKAGHAALLADRLVTLLRGQRDSASVSDLLMHFRRSAVHEGLLAALAVSAYGDADWRL
jgi:hypothetical protein